MPRWALRLALWGPLLVGALLLAGYVYMHNPFARDGADLVAVPLSQDDPSLDRVGDLQYLGGLDIPRLDHNIGGLSGLRWDAESDRLLAITDDARWVWITPIEREGRLQGIAEFDIGALLGLDGEPLSGKAEGDSESLSRSATGGWLVGFERDHRIWAYPDGIDALPTATSGELTETFGQLADNAGLETMAENDLVTLYCVERPPAKDRRNCLYMDRYSPDGRIWNRNFGPPTEIRERGGVPTDADVTRDGTVFILFRSYSPAQGNAVAITAVDPGSSDRIVATLLPPLTVDNFEGLAVREEGGRTFLYIVSDDNFSANQRTLLMKFEVLGDDN